MHATSEMEAGAVASAPRLARVVRFIAASVVPTLLMVLLSTHSHLLAEGCSPGNVM